MPHPLPDRQRDERVLRATLEDLLVSGGDNRMELDEATGLNKYGTAPRVRSAVAFGSCTASSPIDVGLDAARAGLSRLREVAQDGGEAAVDQAAAEMLEQAKRDLARELMLESAETELLFCPSGTDAELLALALVRGPDDGPVVNIVAGPSEVGGGTTHAAGGRHFQTEVPSGDDRAVGAHIDDELGQDVKVRTIVLRDDHGQMLPSDQLDGRAEQLVGEAIASGARALLHVVAHSKTGVHAPSLETVERLCDRYGEKLVVLIDAAQGRLSRMGLKEAINKGYLVLFTGSKFYGGPPFSGAVFVPRKLWPESTGLTALPPGLSDYMSAVELPPSWEEPRDSLPSRPNLGLLLRWQAAVAQIAAYYRVNADARLAVMREWEAAVPALLGQSAMLGLHTVEPVAEPQVKRLLESKTTVFPFYVQRPGQAQPLNREELTRVFHWLNRDLSALVPDVDAASWAVLAREIHVGQPVRLSGEADNDRSVLRVALGGPLVIQVAEDERLAPTFAGRRQWLRHQLCILRLKLELICTHFETLLKNDQET
jgi:hypothetical protein